MKFKALILTLSAFMLLGCSGVTPVKAKANKGDDVPGELKALLNSYKSDDGTYTKKTTICLKDEAKLEMTQYFHASQTQAKRTTYYDDPNQRLLMAKPDGTLDASYGGYRFVTNHIERFHIGEGATLETMFTNTVKDFEQPGSSLNEKYTNLAKFTADGYFFTGDGGWAYEDTYGTYYHNVIPSDDKFFGDMLGFAAPMLYADVGAYLTFKSFVISEKFDANANPYLSIRIYLDDVDTGKLTGEFGATVLSEARIYKGIRPIGDEDLSVGYFVVGSFTDWGFKTGYKLTVTKEEEHYNELSLTGVSLAKDAEFKIHATNGAWYDNWENDVFKRTVPAGNNYKTPVAANYDIYFKLAKDSEFTTITYVGCDVETKTFYLNTGGSSLWNKEGAYFVAHVWNGDGVVANINLEHDSGDVYKVVLPAIYSSAIFCRCNPGADVNWDNWSHVWNQTDNLALPADKNCYTITGWGTGDGNWSNK